jgi:hypothetical protein
VGAGRLRRPALAWIVAGATLAALAAVLLVRLTAPGASITGRNAERPLSAGAVAAAPDISNMTPREAADRLFNRVMAAAERGDTAQITFFGPMAVQAYGMVSQLDADARYHLGMIQVVQGDVAAARAQADTIARSFPNHLLASLLRAEAARAARDGAARDRAWQDLLRHFEPELALGRSEYSDHRAALEAARDQARAALGSR